MGLKGHLKNKNYILKMKKKSNSFASKAGGIWIKTSGISHMLFTNHLNQIKVGALEMKS